MNESNENIGSEEISGYEHLKPDVVRLGDDYVVTWLGEDKKPTVQIGVTRIQEERDLHVTAELDIKDFDQSIPQLLPPQRARMTGTFRGLLSDLSDVSYRDDWRMRLSQVSFHCLKAIRVGEPIIDLAQREAPVEPRQQITNIAWEGMPTVIYGAGGVGKSILALAFANAVHSGLPIANIEAIRGNALILDYETGWDECWRRSAQILDGAGLPRDRMVYYRFCTVPLAKDIQHLKRQIVEKDISLVVIDSVGPACGGDPELAAPTIQYFSALRALSTVDRPVTTISIAHVRKNDDTDSGPFGSVYWTNLPRATFHVIKDQRKGTNFVDIGVHHKKTNVGKLLDPMGFRITWNNGVTIEAVDPKKSKVLSAGGSIMDRAELYLADGPMRNRELAADLGVADKTLSASLSSDDRFESVTVNVNGVTERQWQVKADAGVFD
jgi:hypothetical protein